MADTGEARQNPWLYGQNSPPRASPLARPDTSGPWSGGGTGAGHVHIEPAVLTYAAGVARRLQGELHTTVSHAEPDTAAAARTLGDGWSSGSALTQLLTAWKARWTSIEHRLGMTADRLEATASNYRATDHSAAAQFRAP
ncbi:WXG100 family type VII secretion target [Kitasatospora sp. NPDC048239]|uniref:WXG100 family type VII secretion target n=1 Tax=Kitasatospora sp. NPDC048239 TaxID=3364046 RepID=UPI0037136BC1